MKKIFVKLYSSLAFLILFSSCSKYLIGVEKTNTPANNFQVLWQDFDQHYGAFIPKNINWNEQYVKYNSMISDTMSNSSLFNVLTKTLDVLDDNHVYLRPTQETGLPWYSGGILGRTSVEDFDKKVSKSYLKQEIVYNAALEYGFYPDNIGYINVKDLGEDIALYYKAMDDILNKLKDTKGIVMELRENGGGEDRVSQYIANRFASEKHFSFSSRLRNGPGHNDFGNPINFYTEPEGSFQYTKPVIMLTNLNVYSSGETLVLAMKQNNNVKMVGDVTGGALSDAIERELPNGWVYRLPVADVRDAKGKNLEGIGIQPDILIKNKKEDLQAGHDKALEKALELLR